jgi:hypothetical protein
MKKSFILLVSLFLMLASNAFAQRGTATTTVSGKKIEIEYGRPSLQGRDMLAKLPVGGTWRMGMNDATTLTTEATLKFGGTVVKPGKYRLTAKRVAEDAWHLIINQDSGDNIEVPLNNEERSELVETFTITLDAGHFSMEWGSLRVGTAFETQ